MRTDIATLADVEALTNLLSFLFDQEAEFCPNSELQHAGLRQIIDNPQLGEILILRDGDEVVAMLNLLYTISTALGGRVALLEDMVVHPAQRNHGAGSQLLEYAIQHARRAGCLRITLLSDGENQPAHRFYARQGFVPSDMKVFRFQMPGNRGSYE